jgi:hypothetical protein
MFAGIPGFTDLLRWVRQQSLLRGLGGRILAVRKPHAALNH